MHLSKFDPTFEFMCLCIMHLSEFDPTFELMCLCIIHLSEFDPTFELMCLCIMHLSEFAQAPFPLLSCLTVYSHIRCIYTCVIVDSYVYLVLACLNLSFSGDLTPSLPYPREFWLAKATQWVPFDTVRFWRYSILYPVQIYNYSKRLLRLSHWDWKYEYSGWTKRWRGHLLALKKLTVEMWKGIASFFLKWF